LLLSALGSSVRSNYNQSRAKIFDKMPASAGVINGDPGDLSGLGGVLGRSSCHEEDDGIVKSDSFSRLCSTAIERHDSFVPDLWRSLTIIYK
jgi:hypothetical protein